MISLRKYYCIGPHSFFRYTGLVYTGQSQLGPFVFLSLSIFLLHCQNCIKMEHRSIIILPLYFNLSDRFFPFIVRVTLRRMSKLLERPIEVLSSLLTRQQKASLSFLTTCLYLTYGVFIKYCVFILFFIFLNSASSATALVFYLPGVCTHTDAEGKQREGRVRNICKFLKKKHII